MSWITQATIDTHMSEAHSRTRRLIEASGSWDYGFVGDILIAPSAAFILLGSSGGLLDDIITTAGYVLLEPTHLVEVYAGYTALPNNPMRVQAGGAYFAPKAQVRHLSVVNLDASENARVVFHMAGNIG